MRDDQGIRKMMMSSSSSSNSGGKGSKGKACSWVPHPRTGIYFPGGTGHDEWVMEDVPLGAATFPHSCWFRNVDGVDNHNHPADPPQYGLPPSSTDHLFKFN